MILSQSKGSYADRPDLNSGTLKIWVQKSEPREVKEFETGLNKKDIFSIAGFEDGEVHMASIIDGL